MQLAAVQPDASVAQLATEATSQYKVPAFFRRLIFLLLRIDRHRAFSYIIRKSESLPLPKPCLLPAFSVLIQIPAATHSKQFHRHRIDMLVITAALVLAAQALAQGYPEVPVAGEQSPPVTYKANLQPGKPGTGYVAGSTNPNAPGVQFDIDFTELPAEGPFGTMASLVTTSH